MGGFSFYAIVVGFCLGVLVGEFYVSGAVYIGWFLVVAVGLGLVWHKNRKAIFAPYGFALSLFALALALGLWRIDLANQQLPEESFVQQVGEEVSVEGVIVREPDRRTNNQHLYVKVDDEVLLISTDRYSQFAYGDKVSLTGLLRQPESFTTDLGRTFNYPGYLKAQGVNFTVSYAEVKVLSSGEGIWLLRQLLWFKHEFMDRVEQTISEPAVGLGEGLLLGVKQAIGDEWEDVFRQTGIIHIVVLSGYNVSLVVIFVMYVLSYFLPFRLRLVVGLVAIVCFALLVGLSATVVRASLMAAFILFAKFTGRTYTVIRGLMLAGLLMLFVNPYLLPYDVGFQLSFLATMGLILLSPHIEHWVKFMPTAIGLREFLVATVATQIFVMPLLLYQIGEFSVVSVLVNVLVLPMVPVAMLLTFITGLFGFVSLKLAMPLAFLAYLSLSYILVVAEWFSGLPFAAYVVPPFPFWLVMVSYVFLGYLMWRHLSSDKLVVKSPLSSFDLSQWTIEDESVLKARLLSQKETGVGPAGPTPDKPIFFR